MSMAIGMTVLDGAVLVADGCIQRPLGDKNFIQEDVDKIERLTDSIFAIRFGIEHIAASAIEALRVRLAVNENCRPKALFASLESHLGNEWQSFLNRLPVSVDPDNDALGVGVLCGGLAGGVPFLAGVVHHVIEPNPLRIFGEGPGRIFVIGFQDEDEQEQFYQDIEQILPNAPWEPYEGPLNSCVERLLATSGAAIRSVESQTAGTGGVIRYAVVRKEFPVEKAIWKGRRIRTMEILEDEPTDCPDLPAEINQEIAQIFLDAGLDEKWLREHTDCGRFKLTLNEEKAAPKVMKCLDEYHRADEIRAGIMTGLTVRTASGTTRAEMANSTYPFAYYYGGDKKFYVDTSGNVYGKTFKDTNGQTIISNGLFQGGRLIEAGVVGATGYTEGDYRSAAVENWPGAIHVWNSASKTVPAGKRWIVMVSASRGSLHWFNPRTDWEGHISPMPTYYFKKGATNYESLSAGSHTSLHLYILTASAILGGLPAQDVWEKGKATYIVWEVPA